MPISLSTGVVIGGIIGVLADGGLKNDEVQLKKHTEKGVLLSSGIAAGILL